MALLLSRHNLDGVLMTSDGSGGFFASNQSFVAHVPGSGFLDSFIVRGVETMGAALQFTAGTNLVADAVTLAGTTVSAAFPVTGGAHTTLLYAFRSDGVTITLNHQENGYGTWTWTLSAATQAAELLNDKRSQAGDAVAFVTSGEQRGLPALLAERNQLMRWHYRGFALETHFAVWGVDFNYESVGVLNGLTWQRPLINPDRDYPFVINVVPTSNATTLRALPFTPQVAHNASLYYVTEDISWTLNLGAQSAYQYLLDAGITSLLATWTVRDVADLEVRQGMVTVPLGAGSTQFAVSLNDTFHSGGLTALGYLFFTLETDEEIETITAPFESGYYSVEFTLSDLAGQMLASSFLTRFTVIHQIAGMVNRSDSIASPFTDYAVMGMIGAGAVRESHDMRDGFAFTNPGTGWVAVPGTSPTVWVNQAAYDTIISTAVAQAALYGVNWWFQHVRTNFVTPSQLQAIAQYFVNRYRTQIPIIEIENEPNFIYPPQQYVDNVLVPYATGAAAGGGIALMGPDGVGVPETYDFLATIYANGKGSLLTHVSTHTYPGPGESWEQYGNPKLLEDLRALMTANGDGAKAIWQTEQGYMWLLNSKQEKARYVVRQFLQGWRAGIPPGRQYYFYPQYNGFESWYLARGGEAGSRDSWLPHAASLRFFAENTHGRTFESALATPYRGIYLYRFTGGESDVIAAWTFDFPYTLSFDAPGLIGVTDWMGRNVVPSLSGGHQTLAISGEPVYFHLTTGSAFTVANSSWDTNFALAASGGTASASSEATSPARAIDGNSDTYNTRTRWEAEQTTASGRRPVWLAVNLGQSRTISRFLAFCELPAVDSAPAAWQFQVDVAGNWSTVLFGTAERKWCVTGTFAPVTTTKVRFLVTQENDGWFFTDKAGKKTIGGPTFTQYTDGQLRITELEVYGA